MEQISVGKYKIICFTDKGKELMERVAHALFHADKSLMENVQGISSEPVHSLKEWCQGIFVKGNVLIFIGACGIAVRTIAPFIKDKSLDPAVLVMDERGEFVIPILSGHLGGAVDAGKEIALLTGATLVQTTATDVEGEFAADVYAAKNGLVIDDIKKVKDYTAKLLKTGKSSYYVDEEYEDYLGLSGIPSNIEKTTRSMAEFIISPRVYDGSYLHLIPRCIVVGMGCKRGKQSDELMEALKKCLDELGIDKRAVRAVVSADIKKGEQGLIDISRELGAEFVTYDSDTMMAQEGDFTASDYVLKVTGSDNICERAAAAYGAKKFLMRKRAMGGITVAVGII